jgi:hypothetical protein
MVAATFGRHSRVNVNIGRVTKRNGRKREMGLNAVLNGGHMRRRTFALASLAMLLVSGAGAQPPSEADRRTVPLTSVALVASLDAPPDPDDPGTGGGFETQAYFETRLADARAIHACMDPIEHAVADWSGRMGLFRDLRDRTASSLTLHYVKSGLAGFFAVTYRVEQQVKARVRVDYILLDGTRSPELARDLLSTYQIASLQTSLDGALRCNGRAS